MAEITKMTDIRVDLKEQEQKIRDVLTSEEITEVEQPACETYADGIIPNELIQKQEKEKRRVIVPELVSMTKYLFDNYRLVMYSHLNRSLRNGKLSSMAGCRIRNRVINRDVCRFSHVTYWMIDRSNFIADVDVKLMLFTDRGQLRWSGYLTLWFDLNTADGKFSCHIEEMGSDHDRTDRELVMLSPYLVPYFNSRQMDEAAEDIWNGYLPGAVRDKEKRNAAVLAHKMGLNIEFLPLHKRRDTDSILFFETGTVLTRRENQLDESGPVETVIPANTIVINSNIIKTDYSAFNIYHECFHNEYHYLFFRLQTAANRGVMNNDVNHIRTKEIIIAKDEKVNNPVYWMEKQANRGAYGLMMPLHDMQERISAHTEKTDWCRHPGAKYQQIGRAIARELHLPHFRVRARMIQLGHVYAKGALNYADQRMIEPFVFDPDAWREERHTFVINESMVRRLCEKDSGFREIMDCGKFIYADGHVVRNEPRFVKRSLDGMKLTGWANRHVDQCCLRFEKHFVQKNAGLYVFGRMNYDADYVKQTLFYLEDEINREAMDELEAKESYLRTFPDSFKGAFDKVRKQNGMSIEKMSEELNMSWRTLLRWLDDPEGKVTADFVIMVTLILKLPDWLSDLLFDRAYLKLSKSNKRHLALRHIQRVLWMDGIEKANEYLKEKNLDPLAV